MTILLEFLVVLIFSMIPYQDIRAQDIKTYIPVKATKYLPVMKVEVDNYFKEIDHKEYFGGLVEQESCISLKHSKCWDPTSQLKTSREWGVGLSQITVAYKADGSVRFDSLSDLRKAHLAELQELSWSNVTQRPDLQVRGLVLMSKDNYKVFFEVKDELNRLKMTDSAYNAGPGSVKKRRLQCSLTKGCDPKVWDNNVGSIATLSSKPIYGNRSPLSINNEHVDLIFNKRMGKYRPYLAD